MEHVTPRHLTNGSTAGKGVFCAVRADNYVTNNRNIGSVFSSVGSSQRRGQQGYEPLKSEAEESTELGAANLRGQKPLNTKAEASLQGSA
jgi:hypothetical protein